MELSKISYAALNPRQQEVYNFHKVAAILADYGFTSIRLSDDWQGADFIAVHIDGVTTLRVQLKGRLTLAKKYLGKGLYVAFRYGEDWYLYPHDEVQRAVFEKKTYGSTQSWSVDGVYHVGPLGAELMQLLEPYRITR
jgi:hypothetical protein